MYYTYLGHPSPVPHISMNMDDTSLTTPVVNAAMDSTTMDGPEMAGAVTMSPSSQLVSKLQRENSDLKIIVQCLSLALSNATEDSPVPAGQERMDV